MPSSLYGSWSLRNTSKSQPLKQINIKFADIGKAFVSIFIEHVIGQALLAMGVGKNSCIFLSVNLSIFNVEHQTGIAASTM